MRGIFGLKLQNSPKLPRMHARFYSNANEKSKPWKGLLNEFDCFGNRTHTKFGVRLVRLPSSIELISRIEFDCARLNSISDRSMDYAGKGEWQYNYSPSGVLVPIKAVSSCQNPLARNKSPATMESFFNLTISNCMRSKITTTKPSKVQGGRRMRLTLLRLFLFCKDNLILRLSRWNKTHGGSRDMNLLVPFKRIKTFREFDRIPSPVNCKFSSIT